MLKKIYLMLKFIKREKKTMEKIKTLQDIETMLVKRRLVSLHSP